MGALKNILAFVDEHYGHIILAMLSALPVLIWLTATGFSNNFLTFGGSIASLGKASAFAGLSLYAVMPILSMRHRFIEHIFGGLDAVYRLHASAGKIAFGLILVHPFLLGLGRLIQGFSFSHIWEWTSLAVILGTFGALALIIVTGVTIYSHIRHQSWVIIHRLFGWLIPVYFVHAYLSGGQITKISTLFWYLAILSALGFAAFLYRSVFAHFFEEKYEYEVAEVRYMTDGITELTMRPLSIPINYRPGQFAFLSIQSPAIDPEAHPFSFTTANNGPYVRFVIKALGDDTPNYKNVEPGARAFLEGPFGTFDFRSVPNARQVWIAGGVGMTPFLSMARSLGDNKQHFITMFYAAEKLTDAVFLQEMIDIKRHIPENFDVQVVNQGTSGYLNVDMMQEQLGDLSQYDFMICGPPPMMNSLEDGLRKAGVEAHQIHSERFNL